MLKLADAVAFLKTDNSELKKGLDQGEEEVTGWGGKLGGVMQGVGMAVGLGVASIAADAAGKVVGFMADSVGAASDLNETMSKTGVVFGENSAAVKAWSETAATALGQSRGEALAAASTFGNLFVSMGMATGPSADMSMGLVKLASDLSSFNNIDPAVALEKLRAGMLGQAEPMQALGVNMTAASVTAKALELGLAGTADALTPAMLAQARYAIILEQTKIVQGDFANTSDGLAGQQRIMDAQWKDLSATVGQALLPVVLAFTSALNTLVQAVLPPLQAFMTGRVIPVMEQFGALIEATLGPALNALMGWVTNLGTTVQGTVDGPLAYMQAWWAENMPRIQAIVENVLNALTAFWDQHGAAITATVETLLSWLTLFWDTQMRTVLDVVEVVLQLLTGDFEGAGATLKGIVERWYVFVHDGVMAIVNGIRNWFQSVDWGAVGQAVVDGIWRGMQGAWGNLENWFWDRLDDMRDMLPFSEPKDPASPLRGLRESGAAIVDMLRLGVAEAGQLMAPRLDLAGAMVGVGGASVNVTINIYGANDERGVGRAAEGGVLDALRSAGWKG